MTKRIINLCERCGTVGRGRVHIQEWADIYDWWHPESLTIRCRRRRRLDASTAILKVVA